MEISNFQQQIISDNCFANTFYHKKKKQRQNCDNFFNGVVNNFKNGDWTSLFTLFGSEFNNAKHSSLIPFDLALARLENAIDKEIKRLPRDFKWVWNPEYKYNPVKKTWRLHFHLISNYPLNILYSGENKQVYNIEGLASYLSKSFILSEINNIPLYSFSSNCEDKVKEIINDFIAYYNLYAKLKTQAKNKEKVRITTAYTDIDIIYPCCRGSP